MAAFSIKQLRQRPPTVLGLRLRPFSLGHYLILASEECAYVSDKEEIPTFDDLVFGVFVCALSWEEYQKHIEDETLDETLVEWGKKRGAEFTNKEAVLAESEKFANYILAATKSPNYWIEGDTGKAKGGAHWAIAMRASLSSQLGYSRTEALNAPFVESLADYLAHAESSGAIRLWSEQEQAAIEQMEVANG